MGFFKKNLDTIIEGHDNYLAKANKKGGKKIDMVVYLGDSLIFFNDYAKNWDKRLVKSINKVDKKFYNTFDVNFNIEFRLWSDSETLWNDYFTNYENLSPEDKNVFYTTHKSQREGYIKEYKHADYFAKHFLNLVINQKIKNQDLEKNKIVVGLTKDIHVYGEGIDLALTRGVAYTEHGQESNEHYTVMGLDWDKKSVRGMTHLIQHEVSHLFGAKHQGWWSVMNCYSSSHHWDKKNKKIMKEQIKDF